METKKNDLAYPFHIDKLVAPDLGLTKRELFAIKALSGLLTDPELMLENAVKLSVKSADLLIEELNKVKTTG